MLLNRITNKQVKFLQSLKQKKYRQKYNKYTIEGPKLVKELISQQSSIIDYCITTEDYAAKNMEWLSDQANVLIANSKQIEMMSSMKNAPFILALGSVDDQLELRAFAQNGRYLYLEHAQDPGNMGTMIRTAAWFGMDGVLIGEGSTEIWNQKVIQASMGAVFKIKHKVLSLEMLQEIELPIISTSLNGEKLKDFNWPEGFILCLGNEGKGITDELNELANHSLLIESHNNKGAESLNVASSASILLYHAQINFK
jgi:TrmH family RNA methyltransferase